MEIYEFNWIKNENKEVSDEDFYRLVKEVIHEVADPTFFYLKRLKQLLNLPNIIDKEIVGDKKSLISILALPTNSDETKSNIRKTNRYVIIDDNYKKIILLIYRIQANIPVIIMGETGYGKTTLIEKLNQILNNGENLVGIIRIDLYFWIIFLLQI